MPDIIKPLEFVTWFRNASPYIHAFRGRTFVITFDGEMVASKDFPNFIHDIALLNSLGIRMVLVHGARPQIEQRLKEHQSQITYTNGLRITHKEALPFVKDAVGHVRLEIESLLSMGIANSPMAGASLQVISGNFVTAQPLGIKGGIDFQYTGEVRRINHKAISHHLDHGAIILLSPLGYSPTGEIFNLTAIEVATAVATSIKAEKLLCLIENRGILDHKQQLIRHLTTTTAKKILADQKLFDEESRSDLKRAIDACQRGVRRTHLIHRQTEGALLQELFTRDGVGTLISSDDYQNTRQATIDDICGILELITPLEEEGILLRRSREKLEMEIDHFTVIERDGMIIACAALYPYPEEQTAELACLAVHPDYQNMNHGETLLKQVEKESKKQTIKQLFVLTTRTLHWFQERGFKPASLDKLPTSKQSLYNYQRQSKIFLKTI